MKTPSVVAPSRSRTATCSSVSPGPEEVEPADVAVLRRVVGCYPDYERLLGVAGGHARRRHHGSLLQVAEDLGVHRNTVRNRLDRIEALLGRSLADPQVRVDAWVALQARRR